MTPATGSTQVSSRATSLRSAPMRSGPMRPERARRPGGFRAVRALRAFCRHRGGNVSLYVVLITSVIVGGAALAFDVGRLTIARTQLQNAADAAAMAAAVQLDGQSGARARAEAVARNAASQTLSIETAGGGDGILIDTVQFFRSYTPSQVAASNDGDAQFIQVTVAPRDITLVLEPVLAMANGSDSLGTIQLSAASVARVSRIICDPPPLMICNTDEMGLDDIASAAAAGKQLLLLDGDTSPAPGNFGLMCPPSNSNCGAAAVQAHLAAVTRAECTDAIIATKTGTPANAIENGINSRFDMGSLPKPARDIVSYPQDSAFQAGVVGNANWDRDGYWLANHVGALPGVLSAASRYQVYLYELGESYAESGKSTYYPLPDDLAKLPAGYTVVTPPGENIPAAGVPTSTPVADARRRIIKTAVVECEALGVVGKTDIDMQDTAIIELFITEPASGAGGVTQITGEIVRLLTPNNSNTGVIANVLLVE